jgi:two-component system, LuxR family, sensor kinase FixL
VNVSDLQSYILETLETYKDLFDSAHDLIHIVGVDGKIIYVNQAWKTILGYSHEEITGQSIYTFVHPNDRDRFYKYRQNILKGDNSITEIIIAFNTRLGEKVFLEGFISAKLVNEKPLYTRGIFRDVTRRVRNEAQLRLINEQLKQREANLYHLFYNAPDAIIVIDTASYITYWNPKAEQVFGWKSNEVVGKSLSSLIIPVQHREAHERGMKRYLTTGEEHVLNKTIEITALNREGQEFFISLTISSTFQGDKPAFVAFIRDIDVQKRSALELEQKKMQLELSNQDLEQFAHVASHDIKEPVRKIRMFIDQLRSALGADVNEKSEKHIAKIEKAAARLTEIVEGVLSFATLKGEEFKIGEVDLNEILKNVEMDLELLLESKNGIIKRKQLCIIQGAPFLLYQLFYNLINNALKFSKPGVDPVIEIVCSRITGNKVLEYSLVPTDSYFEIKVIDNGIGFEQKYAEKIFRAFSRLHGKDKYEGTGLGLALCKTIVEKHNGFIKAEGKEDAGATFTIVLPERQGQR